MHQNDLPDSSSVANDTSEVGDGNLIIHGDNLHALKALLPRYAGRIKCIYIDPPYNTGNEGWVYNDNTNSPLMQEWLQQNSPVDGEDLERHDKWLCMMWPRLHLLRELLSDDGIIAISIDDNEQHYLRILLDEIFGYENFIANIIWQKKASPQNDAKFFSDNHDFIALYSKSKDQLALNNLPRTEKQNKRYTNPDNDPRGRWAPGDLSVKTYLKEYDFPIETPSGRIVNPPKGRCWQCGEERLQELIQDNRIWFGAKGNDTPKVKRFLSEVKQGITPLTVWLYELVGLSQSGTKQLKQLDISFSNPKPYTLLLQLMRICTGPDSIILDSFAGSGTTAHAVLALNKEDGGNRKFIMVECEDYADTVTAERVRRVIKGVPEAKDQNLRKGLGGSFTYCTLGDPVDIEEMLTGKSLPTYSELAAYLLHTASGISSGQQDLAPKNEDGLFYSNDTTDYYLLYESSLDWLRSNDAIFNEVHANRISNQKQATGKRAVVFAAGKYMGQRDLTVKNITFCQLPYEMHRTE